MLKNNEPYRYARPALMREKFSHLGETATGKRSPVLRGRPKPSLPEIYEAVKLPSVKQPQKLPRGERRMLGERKLVEFVEELYQPASRQRKAKPPVKTAKRPAARKGGK